MQANFKSMIADPANTVGGVSMSKPKFTPGPWRVDPRFSLRVIAGDDDTIASTGSQSSLRDSWEANANLIAAAPDLYEVVSECCRLIQEHIGATPTALIAMMEEIARPALAKATTSDNMPYGMSLRDWFAGRALAGLCASATFDLPDEQRWAAQVYKFADAMLAERAKL